MEDAEILSLYLARQESALARTAEKYGAYLYKTALNILRSHEDAEEAVEDAYFAAWNAIPPEIPRALRHYLSRITRNIALDKLDYLGAKRRNSRMDLLLSELEDCLPDPEGSVEAAWERKRTGQVIDGFLAELDKQDCALFLCRYYHCMTVGSIGEKYGLPVSTVKYRLARCRKKLRERLEKEGISL